MLGSLRERVETGTGRTAGLEGFKVSKLLSLLAPIVMGALRKARASQHLDPGGLSSFLQSEASQGTSKNQVEGLLSLLDSAGDGQVADDIARIGSRLLEGLFGKKK